MKTDPVSTSTYQPRIRVSISKAQDVARSAGHWKRKLRTRNGPNAPKRRTALKMRYREWRNSEDEPGGPFPNNFLQKLAKCNMAFRTALA
jgi:hypothetical protein